MKPLHIETPFFESRALTIAAHRAVWLKLEAMQPPGAFKIRGIGLACQEYVRRGARRFISSSGGNAGIAVAYAGRHLDVPVVVVVPETTTDRARALIRQEDAEVIVHGASWHEANALALSMVEEADAFLHPFDDPLIWRGHASLVDEVVRSGVKPAAVVLSVGGGGLLSGVVEGLHRNGWTDVPVLAVETEGADSLAQSLRAGYRVELPAITSIATSLGARQICEQAFRWTKQHPLRSIVVPDRAAVSACLRFVADQRVVVEPACGAALAVVYDRAAELEEFESVLVVVCGGVTASIEQLQAWSNEQA
ncbi:MAG: pyridoxal-phosphate dependent enzyme [Gammaproteobacteria bacterium]|nr:pyridoxal-phosphate dependent enzyme [Gammaproteobacteria bacterium]